jgi:uncharacterized membrane protein
VKAFEPASTQVVPTTDWIDSLLNCEQIILVNNIYRNSVRTSKETHYVSATKPNQLMLFRETVAVYCENHTEHTDAEREREREK